MYISRQQEIQTKFKSSPKNINKFTQIKKILLQ